MCFYYFAIPPYKIVKFKAFLFVVPLKVSNLVPHQSIDIQMCRYMEDFITSALG